LKGRPFLSAIDESTVGIVSVSAYSPEAYMTAEEIAAESGLPAWVVREKLGITGKFVGGPDDHPNESRMATPWSSWPRGLAMCGLRGWFNGEQLNSEW